MAYSYVKIVYTNLELMFTNFIKLIVLVTWKLIKLTKNLTGFVSL